MTELREAAERAVIDPALLVRIAADIGTPAYVYDADTIRQAYQGLDQALAGHPHAIHYALKANSSLSLVRLLRGLGASADANSGGEIEVALRAGLIPDQIVFTGVGKTGEELDRAVTLGLKAINAESPGELDRIAARARAQGTTARVALRVNPDIDAKSHPHISTGLRTNKFGMPLEQARHIYREHARQAGLEPVGVHVHVGSQITTVDPLRNAAERVVSLARSLRDDGIVLEHADIGGGLGISYDGTPVPTAADYASAVMPVVRDSGLTLLVEPGRAAGGPCRPAADAGRRSRRRTTAGRDSRCSTPACRSCCGPRSTALTIASSRWRRGRGRRSATRSWDPSARAATSSARDRLLPPLEVDDVLAVLDAGAYGSVMASLYNRHPLPPEVLVDHGAWRVIRRRQTVDDQLQFED